VKKYDEKEKRKKQYNPGYFFILWIATGDRQFTIANIILNFAI